MVDYPTRGENTWYDDLKAYIDAGGGSGDPAAATHAASSKSTPVDADEIPLADSAASYALKKLTWANLKATIATYLASATQTLTNKDLSSGTNTFPTLNQNTTGSAAKWTTARNVDGQALDGTANITVIAPGTHAATSKSTPVDADEIPIVDSAASNVLKKLTWANLKATLDGHAWTLANLPVGGCFSVVWDTDHWETLDGSTVSTRPTSRTDVTMLAKGGTSQPSFAIAGDLWFEDVS